MSQIKFFPFSQNSGQPLFPFVLGWCEVSEDQLLIEEKDLQEALYHLSTPLYILKKKGGYGFVKAERPLKEFNSPGTFPVVGYLPPCPLENLGNQQFCRDYKIRYACLAGSMANGIASSEMVEAMAQQGMLGFFGSAGLSIEAVDQAISRLSKSLADKTYGFNLIHSPNDPELEVAVVDLYLNRSIHLVEASAYLDLTLPVVRFRVRGIHRNEAGEIVTPHRIIAKVSRVEVASKFFSPPPEKFLTELVAKGEITDEQAYLARQIPMARDITAEADSGGHTDNRPAMALLPTMLALRDQFQSQHNYSQPLRIGAAGGIATPLSAAAAFSMGADYILTGSINQSCTEAGTSEGVREMLSQAGQADIAMAPAADMFEMGVKVQVLKRGTMFAMKAAKLYEIYRQYERLEDLPRPVRENLEKNYFRTSLEEIWNQTRSYFSRRDQAQIHRAQEDPKHKMALLFRWYLGQSSRWANSGDLSRKMDYQVWCGPAMGAFNQWAKGSFLESPQNRKVALVALNLLYGAALMIRLNILRNQGIPLASSFYNLVPLELPRLQQYLD